MKTRLPYQLLAALLGSAFASTLPAQTLIHYRLNDTDAAAVASGSVTNSGTLGNGSTGGTGITLSSDVPTNGVPSDAGNRSIVCDGSGGILAPGTQQLSNTAIAGAGGFTYEAWFKWTGGGDINGIIDYAGTEKIIRSANAAGPEMETDNTRFDSIGVAASNEWHYAAVVFTPTAALDSNTNITGNYTFYLDANAPVATVSNVTISTFGDSLNRSIGVGMHPAGFTSDYFHGLIFEPRVTLGAIQAGDLLFQPSTVVTTIADTGAGSLRDVVAHVSSGAVIHFDSSLNGQTIALSSDQILMTNDLTIDASGLPDGIVISAAAGSRVFQINSGASVQLNSLTLANGNVTGERGGAILNSGSLTALNCVFTNNIARGGAGESLSESTDGGGGGGGGAGMGGAVYSEGPSLTLDGCTFARNSAVGGDGGHGGGNGSNFSGGNGGLPNQGFGGNQDEVGGSGGFGGGGGGGGGTLTTDAQTDHGGVGGFGGGGGGAGAAVFGGSGGNGGNGGPYGGAGGTSCCSFAGGGGGGAGLGGAVFAHVGTITITNCAFIGNEAANGVGGYGSFGNGTGEPGQGLGGGLFVDAPDAVLLNSTFTNNSASSGSADVAPIFTLTVTMLADSGPGSLRDAVGSANGVGLSNVIHFAENLSGQTITLTNGQITITKDLLVDASALTNGITISGNGNSRIFLVKSNSALTLDTLTLRDGFSGSANPNAGGAILNYGNLTLNACTLTANRAYDGAAIFNWNGGNSTLNECTLSGNNAQRNSGAIGIRGDTVTLNACTVSANHADLYAGGILVDSDGILVLHNSIVAGNTAGYYDSDLRISTLSGAFSSTSSLTNGDPRLAPLDNYGGPTQTMPPLSGSAAIDAGGSTTFVTDQRGLPRVAGGAADIGAVEAVQSFVTNTNDSGPGSLRQTIAQALPGTTVAFDPGLSGQTITLTNGQIIPTHSLIISASGLAGGITVSGNGNSRIFLVNPDVSLVLDSLNLRDGSAPAGNFFPDNAGGGILSAGNLTVLACTLQNNQATQGTDPGGGGIENYYGTLTINNSTLTENSAGSYGGGIEAVDGRTVIANCTILGNNAPQGGGVASTCKIGDPFETRVMNSIITSNSLDNVNFESDFSSTNNFVSGGHNLIGNGEALPSFNQAGDLTNTPPLLAPLANYGGPTLTMPPLPGSPAIEGGGRANALPGDQRGAARPAGYHPDIGAVEAFPFSAIPLVDTDGDGMDDRMELGYFGNLTTATTNSDFDHDGSSDRDELGNMTDPTDAASLFKIDYFGYYAPGTNGPVYGVSFTSFPGLSYTIEHDQDPSFSSPQTEDVGVVNDYESGMYIELNSDHDFIRVRRNPFITPP